MTREQLIDLIKHRLANGDCPQELKGKYHTEIIAHHIALAYSYLMQSIAYKDAQAFGWDLLDGYAKPFNNVPVSYDSNRNEYYSELPTTVIQLPNNRGVRMIAYMHDQENAFLYRTNNSSKILGKLDVNEMNLTPRYYVESGKVYYSEHLGIEVEKVLMKLIPDFNGLDDDDTVQIPAGYGKLIFDLVFQSMQGMGFEKVSNDNNANTP